MVVQFGWIKFFRLFNRQFSPRSGGGEHGGALLGRVKADDAFMACAVDARAMQVAGFWINRVIQRSPVAVLRSLNAFEGGIPQNTCNVEKKKQRSFVAYHPPLINYTLRKVIQKPFDILSVHKFGPSTNPIRTIYRQRRPQDLRRVQSRTLSRDRCLQCSKNVMSALEIEIASSSASCTGPCPEPKKTVTETSSSTTI